VKRERRKQEETGGIGKEKGKGGNRKKETRKGEGRK